ncbi:Protein kinase-1 [Lonomia obliqua multiple nucleopolyhedrovirus]|uniref:Protein kinase-1 n=1 Tax=Lonomia obliqua multiple nucleopolyhedrovirus TaxID=134394 RepID=A0A126FC23_9ABAC|nr:Protein kinase-1 [Lonomia obliqua multiple nucleopolyhedrovirus]AKN80946.1 Protein kinase-1 [Lonomia obliqua multiple nucleopolyhedrovirus]
MDTIQSINEFYKNCEIFKPKYKVINGRFGKISILSHKPTSKLYLQKSVHLKNFNSDEIQVHQLMSGHSNFIKLYFNYGSLSEHVLIMEYIDCPDLFESLQLKGALFPKTVSNIIRQLCCAINDLHGHGFIHNDIKLENVLYFEALDRVYVCDYGLCRHENLPALHDGTLEYFSPEKIKRQNYARSFDWYAIGILTYKLLTGGKHPFERKSDEMLNIVSMRQRQQYNDINILNRIHDVNARDFVYCLTKYNIDCRLINFRQIIKHEFLNY